MPTSTITVGNMKKITVAMETGTSPETMDLSKQPVSFQFVYGVGTEGLCLFEKALFGKRPDDEILLQVDPQQIGDMFGHLRQSLKSILPFGTPFYLKTRVTVVETANDRELIRAIAEGSGSGCGDGCDCGCGC
jgi:hypothetical protein